MIDNVLFNFVNYTITIHPVLRKPFLSYLDCLFAAHSSKLQWNFLKNCLLEKVIPRTLFPTSVVKVYTYPFPSLASLILKDKIEYLNQVTKQKFKRTYDSFNEVLSLIRDLSFPEEWITKFIDYAHAYVVDKTRGLDFKLKNKLNLILKNSSWWKASNPDFYINLSSHDLSDEQKIILGYGPSFGMSYNNDLLDFVTKFNECCKRFKKDWNADVIKGFLLNNLSPDDIVIPKCLKMALNDLKKNDNIIVTKADKGNKLVILDKVTYLEKASHLLSDISTYEEISHNPLKPTQRIFNDKLKSILKDFPDLVNKFKSFLPRLAQFYGLPKVHKLNCPLRPIVSNVEYITYKLSKWLSCELKTLVGKISGSHIINSSDFIDKIRSVNFSHRNVVSFDVVSLFTNVPLDTTLSWLEEFLVNTDFTFTIPFDILKKLILLQNDLVYFEFNGKYYRQKFGLSMGAPLSPTLACIFMELFEKKFILPQFPGMLWLRYVDDVFAVFSADLEPHIILDYINSLIPSIKFTIENPVSSSLPFLDVLVRIGQDGRPSFSVYRKKTNTNCYVHWYSRHSKNTKNGIMKGQFLRAFEICSPDYLDDEINFIKKTFQNLQYPSNCINKTLRTTKTKFYGQKMKNVSNKLYLSAPVNLSSDDAGLLPRDLCLVSSVKSLKSFFLSGNKKTNPEIMINNSESGIYKINCMGCSKFYIGESDNVKRRQYQHRYDLQIDSQNSALVKHRSESGHLMDINGLETLISVTNPAKRRLLESILIKNTENLNIAKDEIKIDSITNNFLKRDVIVKKILKNNLCIG